MTSYGRQYPDGPRMVYSPFTGRQRPDVLAAVESWAWPALGEVMHNILGGTEPEPGPPYTHTIVPPEPLDWDDFGSPVYPEPGPAMTLTERPIADVVAEAGFRPPAQRIEITADFCQCPACREGRCETVQPERTRCYWPIQDAD